jgi:hypothetical protein
VGGNFGGAWTSGSLNIPGNNFYGGLTEFIGGVQIGYNFQAVCTAKSLTLGPVYSPNEANFV